jgi:hypothetical protein
MKTLDLNFIKKRITECEGIDWASQQAKDLYELTVTGNFFLKDRLDPNICYQFRTVEELETEKESNPDKYGASFILSQSYYDGSEVILETVY